MSAVTTTSSDELGSLRSRVESLEAEVALLKKQRDDEETIEGIRRGLKAVEEGRVRPAHEAFDEMRRRRDIPRA